jgi:hypothetical protein
MTETINLNVVFSKYIRPSVVVLLVVQTTIVTKTQNARANVNNNNFRFVCLAVIVSPPNAKAQAPPPEPDAGCNDDAQISWSRQN